MIPEEARRYGFDYLRGRLLESLGRDDQAQKAYASAIGTVPALESYSLLVMNTFDASS